ncbi:MAG: PHP domain-containing protein [Clostridia bacterium]|nr:PHP domain-containing protein [Clostridia bacterium]
MFCDLHTHSFFSDGTCTPEEIVDGAIEAGLSAVALTDHNTVDGLRDFIAAARGKDIEIVPGAEFSVDYQGTELHILGLFIPPEAFGRVSERMESVNRRKEASNIALIDSLNRAGYCLDYEEIKGLTPNGKVNRAHIATAMVKKGYIGSVKEGFDTLLSKSAGHYQEPARLTAAEIIAFIKSIGAVPVLAHPFLNLSEQALVGFLSTAKGLCGIECYYATYDGETTKKSLRIAEQFNLLCSGGSDFHGTTKPDIGLGIGKGTLRVPYACYLALRERAKI